MTSEGGDGEGQCCEETRVVSVVEVGEEGDASEGEEEEG